jgi:hypothetical protein
VARGEATRGSRNCSAAARRGKRERRGSKGARRAQRRGQVRPFLWSRQWREGGCGRALGVELCSASCCVCRGTRERVGKEKRERGKEKGEKGRERGLRRRDSRRRSRECGATREVEHAGEMRRRNSRRRSRECGATREVKHAARRGGRGKERMTVNFGCQMAKGREIF